MKITIENVKANKTMFENITQSVIDDFKLLDSDLTVVFNNVELSTKEAICSHDKTHIDVLEDLVQEEVEINGDETAIEDINNELKERLEIED